MTSRVHLRCGDDLRGRLPPDPYHCIADPVCFGPAGDGPGWLEARIAYVSAHSGQPPALVSARLSEEYAALRSLAAEAVWLWFEHDVWDQCALLRALSLLPTALRDRLWLLPADGRHGFAELDDATLAALPPAPLSPVQWDCARAAWGAFTATDPRGLAALARQPLPLPFLAAALRRHLQDLPWRADGLALTERQVLHAVAAGATGWRQVFTRLARSETVMHHTDLQIREVVQRLQAAGLLDAEPLALSPAAQEILAGQARHRPAPRPHAGVQASAWLWDEAAGEVMPA